MQYRKFGNTDLHPSVMGLGAAPIGSRTGRDESLKTLHEAFELGITFYDTAPSYGQGASEKIIGEAFKKRRDKVIITTKVGNSITPTLQLASKIKPFVRTLLQSVPGIRSTLQKNVQQFVKSQIQTNFEPSYIAKSVEDSLRHLDTDYIDLLLLHSPSKDIITEEVFDHLKSLKQQGKVRYYGISSSDLETTLMCVQNDEFGISALQVRLNLFEQQVIDKLLPLANQKGVAIIAREPFAHGMLIPPASNNSGLNYMGPRSWDDRFTFLAKENMRTMTQAALQFVLQTEGVSVVLPGMSKVKHVYENVEALSAKSLTSQEMEKIRSMLT
ncbi:MAG: aldo/keto reductase [Xenococcaceae cyanobacterium MO_188.B32]|nr:aldo/keto reductase [Xenococcaceae cyanobacterium MO_188.B32]